ncbi:nucleoside-diphosphate sugar epimerase/dehydratase [Cryobacterium sp. Y50]|uniref:polysaccharide biosynthesis protein n=1 Tax=Cryobacterium sp. Y50 TaxID=2048286 RepID=UPI000CE46A0A|nr:nucleoside-diphosphate sugar epimerase/dehydratase [Cryobacterium sp. Y50]
MRTPTIKRAVRSRGAAVRRTIGGQVVFDSAAWTIAIVLATIFRYEFAVRQVSWAPLFVLCAIAIVLQCFVGRLLNLYRGRFKVGTFHEVQTLALTSALVAVVIGLPVLIFGTVIHIPRSAILVAYPIALVLMGGARYLRRLRAEIKAKPGESAERTIIYGAGYLAGYLVPQMLTDRHSKYLPVALVDDSPTKRNFSVHGIHVMGTRDNLSNIARRTEATMLIVCIARANAALIRDITDAASHANLRVLVLPLMEELLEGGFGLGDLKDVSIEDLIGRNPVDTEIESIADYLTGKRVLVTGAGGSIGSVLSRQIAKFDPAELMMLDRDESGLQATQIAIDGNGLLDTRDVILADIRDPDALGKIFAERRPEVVFHAAALKHLPMLEQYPDEAWKTNVIGTLNVLQAARSVDVGTFINISTDKAANPTSILGHSKRVAEKLTSWAAMVTGRTYLSVRFGNVIGSRGSMLPTFTALIESGGPVTITHPDVTRFFMTIPEACQLVVQAGGIGRAGEVLILDMGLPVRILDIAERMIAMSGKHIDIVYTGLRQGEKIHEDLLGDSESDSRPVHPKISHAVVDALDPERLDKPEWDRRCGAVAPYRSATESQTA